MKNLGKALMIAAVCSVATTAMAQPNGNVEVADWFNNHIMLSAQIGDQYTGGNSGGGQISANRSGTGINFSGHDPKNGRNFTCNVYKGDALYEAAYNAVTDLREGGRVLIIRPENSNKCSEFVITGISFNFSQ
ncbi:hypothetical protein [Hahella sp. NBU794]|uniref:hypothetical protein n=1 Tax=Hahella sp. NBU794 TaxID=3422590 RepID=UPI003D6EF62C